MSVNSYSGFQPLQEIWLGDCYPTSFYDNLESETKDAFVKITEMTKNDLNLLQKKLETFGVVVQRPEFKNDPTLYTNDKGYLRKPPIVPRDENLTLGDTFYHLRNHYKVDPWKTHVDKLKENGKVIESNDGGLACLNTPSIVRLGKDIVVDWGPHKDWWHLIAPTIMEWSKDYRVQINLKNTDTYGHSDGIFCPVAPGVIVSTFYNKEYSKTFPDWDIYYLDEPTMADYNCNWFIDDNEIMKNAKFNSHLEKFARDWIGNIRETVFEVNMLVIDEKNVLAIAENEKLFNWLNKKGINVHLVDFKTRSFWDGGLHCLTCDINRDGGKQDYFPSRPKFNYLEWIN